MKKKKILILRACGIEDEEKECDNIRLQCELYDLDVHDYCLKTNDDLKDALSKGIQFDYIYLSSHGDESGFQNETMTIRYTWTYFGVELCGSACMNPECVVMLSCCRGGLNQVAYDLFFCCPKIAFIVGPRQSLFPHDMLISFNIFLYNLEHKNVDPIVACEKIKEATDIRFICFDRLETEIEVGYLVHNNRFDVSFRAILNKAREKAHEPLVYVPATMPDEVRRMMEEKK